MKKFADFTDYSDLYELKPGWVIRKPFWFTDMDMAMTRFAPVVIGALGAGTAIGIKGSLEQGKQAEEIAKQRAAIDIQNAAAARKASVEKAKIQKERGRRLIETQKGIAAGSNIRINVGAPLVLEAQTRADIAKDIGFTLERGEEAAGFYRSRAALERVAGKAARRKSKWDAISQGLMGFGSIAFMGTQAGLFGKPPVASPEFRNIAQQSQGWLQGR